VLSVYGLCRLDVPTAVDAAYLVGRQIRIFWAAHDAWFLGEVKSFLQETSQHEVSSCCIIPCYHTLRRDLTLLYCKFEYAAGSLIQYVFKFIKKQLIQQCCLSVLNMDVCVEPRCYPQDISSLPICKGSFVIVFWVC
jgi:hypothetical protein